MNKPYTISPTTQHQGVWGIEIATLTDETAEIVERSPERGRIRLGTAVTRVGEPVRIQSVTWPELARPDGTSRWTLEFVTPFAYRSRNRVSPFPLPSVILRTPAVEWAEFSGQPPISVAPAQHNTIWVSDIDVHTDRIRLKGRETPGLLGSVTYRCEDDVIAPTVSTLLRLAEYTGVGSFRGKGMGIVALRAA